MVFTVLFMYPGMGVSYGIANTTCKRRSVSAVRKLRERSFLGAKDVLTDCRVRLVNFQRGQKDFPPRFSQEV